MTVDHYLRLIQGINDQLQAIAEMAAAQGLAGGGAELSNPLFLALMKQHERLTQLSGQITSQIAAMAAAHAARSPAPKTVQPKRVEPGARSIVGAKAVVIHLGRSAAPARFVPGLTHIAAVSEEDRTVCPADMAAGARRYALQVKR